MKKVLVIAGPTASGKTALSIQLAKALNVTRRTIARDIEKLKNEAVIKRIGSDKSGYWEIISHTND